MRMWGATTLTNQKICENILRMSVCVCVCSGVKTTHYVIVTTKELEKSEGNVGEVCDIITHQGQAGFQDMVAVV